MNATSAAIIRRVGSKSAGIVQEQGKELFIRMSGSQQEGLRHFESTTYILLSGYFPQSIYCSKAFYAQVKQILTALCSVIVLTISAEAQSTSCSFRQACSMTVAGQPTICMLCRWISGADTGNSIFVDNASTGETYELNGLSPEWRADPKIINKFKTSVWQL